MSERIGRADVELAVDDGRFHQQLGAAEQRWRDTTARMSDADIRLSVAQEKLNRSIAKYGPESIQARRATLALRQEHEAITRTYDREGRELGQLSRATSHSNGVFRSFRGALGLASGALGGAGLVYWLKTAKDASANLAEQTDFTRRTFRDSAGVVTDYANDALGLARDQALAAASGLGSLLVPLVKDREESAKLSVQLTKLGVDLASIKNTRVEDSLAAIRSGLVGESEPLRQYAVLLSEAKVQQQALAQTGKQSASQLTEGEKVLARVAIILREAGYAAGNYAETIEGTANKEREAAKNWRNSAILIGDTLRPAYDQLLGSVNRYIGNADNQREIQDRVNAAVKTGEQVVRGLAGGVEDITGVLRPAIRLLGGFENAAKVAFSLLLLSRIRRITAAIAGIGPAAVRSAALSTTAMGRIDSAARRSAGPGGGLALMLNRVTAIGTGLYIVDELTGGHGQDAVGRAVTTEAANVNSTVPRRVKGVWVAADGRPVQDQQYWERKFQRGEIDAQGRGRAPGSGRAGNVTAENQSRSADVSDKVAMNTAARDPQSQPRPDPRLKAFTPISNATLIALERALRTESTGDELAIYLRERDRIQAQIRRGFRTKAELLEAEQALTQVVRDIEAIRDREAELRAQTREEAAKRRAAARKRSAETEAKEFAKLVAELREVERGYKQLGPNEIFGTAGLSSAAGNAAARRAAAALNGRSGAGGTRSSLKTFQDFLEQLTGLGPYASNIFHQANGRLVQGSQPIVFNQTFQAPVSQSEAMRDARLAALARL